MPPSPLGSSSSKPGCSPSHGTCHFSLQLMPVVPAGDHGAYMATFPSRAAGSGGSPGTRRLRRCPDRVVLIPDLTRTSPAQINTGRFSVLISPTQGLRQCAFRHISIVTQAFSPGCLAFKNLRRSDRTVINDQQMQVFCCCCCFKH